MRRPGGQSPSIQPISITMLGSLIVTQRRQYGASAGTIAGDVAGEHVGRAGAQPELLAQPPRVGEVVQRDHGRHAPCCAHGEDLGVALERGVVERPGTRLQPGPFHREPEGVAPDGRRPVQRLLGMPPEVARQARARRPARGLPAGPVVVGLAVAVEAALDLVARRGDADGEALAEQASSGRRRRRQSGGLRPAESGGAGRSAAARAQRPTAERCPPRRAPGARGRDLRLGGVAPRPQRRRLDVPGGADHLGHLVPHRVGPPVPRGRRRSSRSSPSSSPATERSDRHTDGSSATGASLDSAWATATSASSTATHMRRRTRAAVPR